MAATQDWNLFFNSWPASLPRKGVLQTNLSETMPFKNFWLKGAMLLIERVTPDAMDVVKFTNPLSAAEISEAGFRAEAPNKQPQRQPQPA